MKGRGRKETKKPDLGEAIEVQRCKREDLSKKERVVKEASEEQHGLH